jgi:RNA polymerase sigma-70 factor (ECF subfamily)
VRQREVVALRYFGQLSTDEAAVALGIASGTVKAHLHRAVRALAADLEELQP